ncbi:hypothetical protein HDU96_008159 [Phlyctochytrium bullatum]|nr:hypothetical protein HDU96_008159 [Phlyctochytrium bullatum]
MGLDHRPRFTNPFDDCLDQLLNNFWRFVVAQPLHTAPNPPPFSESSIHPSLVRRAKAAAPKGSKWTVWVSTELKDKFAHAKDTFAKKWTHAEFVELLLLIKDGGVNVPVVNALGDEAAVALPILPKPDPAVSSLSAALRRSGAAPAPVSVPAPATGAAPLNAPTVPRVPSTWTPQLSVPTASGARGRRASASAVVHAKPAPAKAPEPPATTGPRRRGRPRKYPQEAAAVPATSPASASGPRRASLPVAVATPAAPTPSPARRSFIPPTPPTIAASMPAPAGWRRGPIVEGEEEDDDDEDEGVGMDMSDEEVLRPRRRAPRPADNAFWFSDDEAAVTSSDEDLDDDDDEDEEDEFSSDEEAAPPPPPFPFTPAERPALDLLLPPEDDVPTALFNTFPSAATGAGTAAFPQLPPPQPYGIGDALDMFPFSPPPPPPPLFAHPAPVAARTPALPRYQLEAEGSGVVEDAEEERVAVPAGGEEEKRADADGWPVLWEDERRGGGGMVPLDWAGAPPPPPFAMGAQQLRDPATTPAPRAPSSTAPTTSPDAPPPFYAPPLSEDAGLWGDMDRYGGFLAEDEKLAMVLQWGGVGVGRDDVGADEKVPELFEQMVLEEGEEEEELVVVDVEGDEGEKLVRRRRVPPQVGEGASVAFGAQASNAAPFAREAPGVGRGEETALLDAVTDAKKLMAVLTSAAPPAVVAALLRQQNIVPQQQQQQQQPPPPPAFVPSSSLFPTAVPAPTAQPRTAAEATAVAHRLYLESQAAAIRAVAHTAAEAFGLPVESFLPDFLAPDAQQPPQISVPAATAQAPAAASRTPGAPFVPFFEELPPYNPDAEAAGRTGGAAVARQPPAQQQPQQRRTYLPPRLYQSRPADGVAAEAGAMDVCAGAVAPVAPPASRPVQRAMEWTSPPPPVLPGFTPAPPALFGDDEKDPLAFQQMLMADAATMRAVEAWGGTGAGVAGPWRREEAREDAAMFGVQQQHAAAGPVNAWEEEKGGGSLFAFPPPPPLVDYDEFLVMDFGDESKGAGVGAGEMAGGSQQQRGLQQQRQQGEADRETARPATGQAQQGRTAFGDFAEPLPPYNVARGARGRAEAGGAEGPPREPARASAAAGPGAVVSPPPYMPSTAFGRKGPAVVERAQVGERSGEVVDEAVEMDDDGDMMMG